MEPAVLAELRIHHIMLALRNTHSLKHFFGVWKEKHTLPKRNGMWNRLHVGEFNYVPAHEVLEEHHLWGVSTFSVQPERVAPTSKKVSFGEDTQQKNVEGSITTEPVECLDGCETPRGKFASIITKKAVGENIEKYITGDINALEKYFEKAMKSLESGENFKVWDGQSTQLRCGSGEGLLKRTYDEFKRIVDPTELEKKMECLKETQRPVTPKDDIEARFQRLLAM